MITKLQISIALVIALTSGFANATPIEIITNGGFETGDFTGWSVNDVNLGSFAVVSGTTPPNGTFTTPGASQGSFYAVSYQGGPGTHALSQSFTVPVGTFQLNLSFDMFVQTFASLTVNPAGLDDTALPNQHARVDLLNIGSTPFDTGAGVIANFYLGIDGVATQPYKPYSFDISSLVTPGSTYLLRFAQADNQGNFNQGVDNVSILADTSQVPEPASIALLGLGAMGMFAARRRKTA